MNRQSRKRVLEEEEDDNDPASSDDEDDSVRDDDEEITESSADEYRTISVTLAKVLKPSIDYQFFMKLVEDQQRIANNAINDGLQHVLSLLTEMILNGSFQNCIMGDSSTPSYFQYSQLDLNNIGEDGTDRIAIVNKNLLEVADHTNLFSYHHFYQLLSTCIGDKKKIERTTLIETLIDKMDISKKVDYKAAPWIDTAVKKFHTNFKNMWNHDSLKKDLKVISQLFQGYIPERSVPLKKNLI